MQVDYEEYDSQEIRRGKAIPISWPWRLSLLSRKADRNPGSRSDDNVYATST